MSTTARTVLVVDDETGITTALCRVLGREGYAVTVCNEPREALARLGAGAFDVIISDQRMPGMTGTELMKLVKARHPDVLRVLLTGEADVAMAIEAINHGEVYRLVTKPWNQAELKATLETGIRQLDSRRESRRVGAVVERWNASF